MTLEDGDGTTARFVDGQRGIEITATGNQISIEGPPGDFIGDHAVVSTTGISCQGTGANQQPTDDNTGTADDNANAADAQYAADGKEVTVIIETIPDKGKLVDTGGPSLPMVGGVILAVGLVGLGIFSLRRT